MKSLGGCGMFPDDLAKSAGLLYLTIFHSPG